MHGETVSFRAAASDPDIASEELIVEWLSDKDGSLQLSSPSSSGEIIFAYDGLTADTHLITLQVSDEVGALCTDQILLQLGTPPTAIGDNPSNGAIFYSWRPNFLFKALFPIKKMLSDLVTTWSSSIDGELQTGGANSQGLSQLPPQIFLPAYIP